MPQPVIHGTITVSAGQPNVNYIGLAGLGFEKVSADEWQVKVNYTNWADYKALLTCVVDCGVNSYNYNPAICQLQLRSD